jgi:uncharacterized membrane protein
MGSLFIGIFFLFISSILNAISPFLIKKNKGLSWLIIGTAIYGISYIIAFIGYKYGPISVLFPIISFSYIWTFLLSIKYLNEKNSLLKWIGVCLICFGILLVIA